MNHQKVKTQVYNKRAHPHRGKGKPRASTQRDQREHTTETHRIPTIEVHPTKIASKAKHQEAQTETQRVT